MRRLRQWRGALLKRLVRCSYSSGRWAKRRPGPWCTRRVGSRRSVPSAACNSNACSCSSLGGVVEGVSTPPGLKLPARTANHVAMAVVARSPTRAVARDAAASAHPWATALTILFARELLSLWAAPFEWLMTVGIRSGLVVRRADLLAQSTLVPIGDSRGTLHWIA
jgi:hypothetical protein